MCPRVGGGRVDVSPSSRYRSSYISLCGMLAWKVEYVCSECSVSAASMSRVRALGRLYHASAYLNAGVALLTLLVY